MAVMLREKLPFILPVFALFASVWTAFIFYRCWLLMKEESLKSGQLYERLWRYKLPPEYADSEDAWTAAERRKRAKKTMRQRQRKP
ncbi:MAG: hypothetical protein KA233_12490 [Novosphingobium sp.]|nr:hypothetical protein [Novosphingobium sp.]